MRAAVRRSDPTVDRRASVTWACHAYLRNVRWRFKTEAIMDIGWFLLGFFSFVLVFAFLHVVSRMASERESLFRRKRSRGMPLSGDTITYAGHS